ncbi:hypothetical protein KW516_18330 [Vibrio fluvialis]|nr:hypothetical protein [Vibrio fluvialis]
MRVKFNSDFSEKFISPPFKNIVRDFLRILLGKKNYIKFRFMITHGYIGDFDNPKSWSEKIQHRKLYGNPSYLSRFVDKYIVRDYISQTVGSEYLIPIIDKFSHISEADFDKLPKEFVIKLSNGGGGKFVDVVFDKRQIVAKEVAKKFNYYTSLKLGSSIDEPFYDVNPSLILVEELIKNPDSSTLLDYKFHIFKSSLNREVFLQINSNYGKESETKTLYRLDGVKHDIQFLGYKYGPDKIDLPPNFSQMVDLAINISPDLNYSRVDLYNVNGKIYFGEITLCPASGWDKVNKKEYDFYLGSLWE